MNIIDETYEDFLTCILYTGEYKNDRTGTGTYSVFGYTMRFDLNNGFPLITTKKVHFRSVLVELLWFLHGYTNVQWLKDHGVSIWNEWADEFGNLGPVYGAQWRTWPDMYGGHIDQISNVIDLIKKDPDSRRLLVSAWNVSQLDQMALMPCHVLFQFYVSPEKDGRRKLDCQLYQRSADAFLGVPFNIASYSLLTHMVAQQCDLDVGEFIWTGGDCHIYSNHVNQVNEQLSRIPRSFPSLNIKRKADSIFDYNVDDFEIVGYDPHPAISAPVAV